MGDKMNKYRVTFRDENELLQTVVIEACDYEFDNGFATFFDKTGNKVLSVCSAIVSTITKS